MMGNRGASRYIKDPDVFRLETEAIKSVRKEFKNLWEKSVNELNSDTSSIESLATGTDWTSLLCNSLSKSEIVDPLYKGCRPCQFFLRPDFGRTFNYLLQDTGQQWPGIGTVIPMISNPNDADLATPRSDPNTPSSCHK